MGEESGCLRLALRYTSVVGAVLGLLIDIVTIGEWLGLWLGPGQGKSIPSMTGILPTPGSVAGLRDITVALLIYVGLALAILSAWSPRPGSFVRAVAVRSHMWALLVLAWATAFVRPGNPYQYLHLVEGWIAGGLVLLIWRFRFLDERRLPHMVIAWCLLGLAATALLAPVWGAVINRPLHGWSISRSIELAVVWGLLGTVFSAMLWLGCAVGAMMLRPLIRHVQAARI